MEQLPDDPFDRDGLRAGFLVYTRRAYAMLSPAQRPRILDIGCGSGVPTLELARLSEGEVIGIDIDARQLSVLHYNIQAADLEQRVACVRCSMQQVPFSDNTFNILWAEGSVAVIGFSRGLNAWRRLLDTDGYLVLHDDVDDIAGKQRSIHDRGYRLIDHFIISKHVWWETYYGPLQDKIASMKEKGEKCDTISETIQTLEHEIDQFRSTPKYDGSVFFILQKAAGTR